MPPAPPSCSSALLDVATEMLGEAGGCSCPSFGVQKAPAERAARACSCHIVPSHVLPPPVLSGGSLSHHRCLTWLLQGLFLPQQCRAASSAQPAAPGGHHHLALSTGLEDEGDGVRGAGLRARGCCRGDASPARPDPTALLESSKLVPSAGQ